MVDSAMTVSIPEASRSGDAATSSATNSDVTGSQSFKSNHTILLDSSPILLNTPSISTLLSQCHTLVTTESVISEIRDADARLRVETTYRPFLTIRAPKPQSVRFVRDFARRTGDVAVLSGTDLQVLALAYDLECERNGGDWRLRRVPGQKRINGKKPTSQDSVSTSGAGQDEDKIVAEDEMEKIVSEMGAVEIQPKSPESPLGQLAVEDETPDVERVPPSPLLPTESQPSSDSDSDGWITPSNIKKHQAKESTSLPPSKSSGQRQLQVATITGDFAMQNVLLQMSLNLLSPKTCKRITSIKQTILRCHGCFLTTKEMNKQFCPRCGKPTLTRVSCTTNDRGQVQLHLKAKMQWNNKGNVFSVPKPVSGRSNQKWTGPRDGGGKGGWGGDLVLAEDQKEYVRFTTIGARQKSKQKDLMDEDYLPAILTGERAKPSGRVRVGVNRNINTRKR